MIATLLNSASYVSYRSYIGCGPLFVWPTFRTGSVLGSLIRSSVPEKRYLQLMLGIHFATIDVEEILTQQHPSRRFPCLRC